jgi:AcrR family transcriptional regulator
MARVTAAGTADGREVRGEQTRRTILRRAANIASVEGLDGLSLGRLATDLGISKSGVFAHFGSKEDLQLATIAAAAEIFRGEVVSPAEEVPAGIGRVWRLSELKFDHLRRQVFAGGCFFVTVANEFDARPGRVRDEIARYLRRWRRYSENTLEDARALGQLDPGTDSQQLAFELEAFYQAGNGDALLYDDATAYDRARRAALDRLRAACPDPDLLPAGL